jgi:hypothetical protein
MLSKAKKDRKFSHHYLQNISLIDMDRVVNHVLSYGHFPVVPGVVQGDTGYGIRDDTDLFPLKKGD